MKQLLAFKTTLSRIEVTSILKENTFPTAYDFQTLLFGKHYFSGQITDKAIRIKNATRNPRNPSPIFFITLITKDNSTEVVIQDDTADDIRTHNMMMISITTPMSIVVMLVGGILSFVQPGNYSFPLAILISIGISAVGFANAHLYKQKVKSNTKQDLEFLIRLLQR